MPFEPLKKFKLPAARVPIVDPDTGVPTKAWYDWFYNLLIDLGLIAKIAKALGSLDGSTGFNGLFIQDAAPTPVYTGQKYWWIQTNAVGTQCKFWIEDGA